MKPKGADRAKIRLKRAVISILLHAATPSSTDTQKYTTIYAMTPIYLGYLSDDEGAPLATVQQEVAPR